MKPLPALVLVAGTLIVALAEELKSIDELRLLQIPDEKTEPSSVGDASDDDVEGRKADLSLPENRIDTHLVTLPFGSYLPVSYLLPFLRAFKPGLFLEHFEKNSEQKNSVFFKNSVNFPQKLAQINLETQCTGTVY